MRSIGLNSKRLLEIAIAEHSCCLDKKLESVNNNKNIPQNLKSIIAEREAILQAIAKMIEENNKAIFLSLKNNDIIKDTVNP
ncbi:hypothetical protein GTH52_07020 [Clostridium tyrobutyricum]|uniref:Uncharacterized protein n=1 Tax=Clostridium tyrobutyricum DIVETGP TaxID=1408889 RepID=W6N7V8_CLOTY|nr:hypothetical protein [Clostridium tyrobutyricum]AND84281.1 hypothetical protein CTK_C10200 [Clostridium tyrobutyricum]AND84365.1 hypothetical protein CTK_C11040 [Clostridium tyrobutyricum]ANP68993.1 hypothetical protein BA182_04685 [Clostridium tyrobutyricum]MBV4432424.1 hypothetical protein [Clostridium tyrobutyricum]MBV4435402.1 hypothetical protein [Clostridium tyrobutyricum]